MTGLRSSISSTGYRGHARRRPPQSKHGGVHGVAVLVGEELGDEEIDLVVAPHRASFTECSGSMSNGRRRCRRCRDSLRYLSVDTVATKHESVSILVRGTDTECAGHLVTVTERSGTPRGALEAAAREEANEEVPPTGTGVHGRISGRHVSSMNFNKHMAGGGKHRETRR